MWVQNVVNRRPYTVKCHYFGCWPEWPECFIYSTTTYTRTAVCMHCCIFFTPKDFVTYLLWLIFILPSASNHASEQNGTPPQLFRRIILKCCKLVLIRFAQCWITLPIIPAQQCLELQHLADLLVSKQREAVPTDLFYFSLTVLQSALSVSACVCLCKQVHATFLQSEHALPALLSIQ